MTKDEVWEILKDLGAEDRLCYEREIEYAVKYLDSEEAVRELDSLISWESRY